MDHYVFSDPKDGAKDRQIRNLRKSQQRSGNKVKFARANTFKQPNESLEGRDIRVALKNGGKDYPLRSVSELQVEGSERSGSLYEPVLSGERELLASSYNSLQRTSMEETKINGGKTRNNTSVITKILSRGGS